MCFANSFGNGERVFRLVGVEVLHAVQKRNAGVGAGHLLFEDFVAKAVLEAAVA